MKLNRIAALASAALLAVGLTACSENAKPAPASSGSAGAKELNIVASTGYLADAIANIAPNAKVTTLVAPGGDPHTQELTTADIQKVDAADLVVWTSHDMEHKMMAQFDNLKERSLPAAEAIPEKDLLPWEEDGKVEGHDPHVWNSPILWKYAVNAIAQKLGTIDSANKATYEKNAKEYTGKIDAAYESAKKVFDSIPAEKRVLVTGHDAFNYLGKTFGLEIHATDFVSSESEMSATQLDELATMIATKKVHVVFQDNLKNPEVIKHLQESVAAKGGKVEVSDKVLYADTLGDSAPVNTYLGAFEHNAKAIAEALTK
ncbi:manganese/zinc/iron transport system substrate-binding protein [Arcanobacterium wilhelmae]|uniref:Manganese/zinc/iron transport system substrate-binding protein n=1 Tax=Arcanobacterium wilhelmae TaxID=1803177 RepID=A0ABT9NAW1_9ACTO|nr:metal ABC transporter substrate-binding protein [Arcanobacterium wilhelmae]MDP9800346.1 manganese/zinc/iron transport system substrate-binding protein [Arcanobacterium wilhelmae]WFN89782.1 metal ABC transporter substrate-binding protein [Arcanobacterium wilhelmae]